ncbi:MAG TPA: DUF721 domain-containing protein [Planctomycetota bacterium]|jgi:hypothetical protein|nr:DUF721 domain-containing protein [Planctomycetota bacterium]
MTWPSRRSEQREEDPIAPRAGGAPIQDILDRWLKTQKGPRRATRESLSTCWKQVVGQEVAAHTRIVDLSGGELLVEVDSAPLLNELSTYLRQEIVESLHGTKEFRSIRSIRFRPGSF